MTITRLLNAGGNARVLRAKRFFVVPRAIHAPGERSRESQVVVILA